jgi:hypothetical protein
MTVFNRIWAMPSPNTFDIPPIGEFVKHYLSGISVDPFARNKRWATYTNDLNPNTEADSHMDILDFLGMLKEKGVKANTVIFDPPYSPRQMSEVYQSVGLVFGIRGGQRVNRWKQERDLINEIMVQGGIVLSFGWNTIGMGKKRGYKIEEIILICHGGGHNDTICMAERKIQGVLSFESNMGYTEGRAR